MGNDLIGLELHCCYGVSAAEVATDVVFNVVSMLLSCTEWAYMKLTVKIHGLFVEIVWEATYLLTSAIGLPSW